MLSYKLKCPYIFGDEAIHEFVPYWDIQKNHQDLSLPSISPHAIA